MGSSASAAELRRKIQEADDESFEDVDVPEWGVKLRVSSLTSKERGRYLKQAYDPKTESIDWERIMTSLVIACATDPESGERIFTSTDEAWLQGKSAAAVDRVFEVAQRLNKLDREATANAARQFPDGPS